MMDDFVKKEKEKGKRSIQSSKEKQIAHIFLVFALHPPFHYIKNRACLTFFFISMNRESLLYFTHTNQIKVSCI